MTRAQKCQGHFEQLCSLQLKKVHWFAVQSVKKTTLPGAQQQEVFLRSRGYADIEGSFLISFPFSDDPPPRPPLPAEVGGASSNSYGPGRGYTAGADTTDDESEEIFHKAPTPSQGPIMVSKDSNTTRHFIVK